jgi:enediyne biosynthesis thioesterase
VRDNGEVMKAYIYRPTITFESTNVVGNVYFARFVSWQGACRELFLKEYAPSVLRMVIEREVVLHTTKVSCEFHDPVGSTVNDEISVEMTLTHLRGGRMTVHFDYFREENPAEGTPRTRIAIGDQSMCIKRMTRTGLVPVVFPVELLLALRQFTDSSEILDHIEEATLFAEGRSAIANCDHG